MPQGAGARPGKAARGGLLGRGLRRESGIGEAEARRRGCPGGRDKAVRAARVEESGRGGQGRVKARAGVKTGVSRGLGKTSSKIGSRGLRVEDRG